MRRLAPALLLLLSSCFVPHGASGKPDSTTSEIITAIEGIYDDLSSRRWEAFQAHFLAGATLIFSDRQAPKRITPPEFIEMVKKQAEGKEVFEERMTNAWIRRHEDMAFVWTDFAGRIGTAIEFKTWSGVDAFTLIRVNGRWMISQIAVSKDPPEEKEKE
jgi:hypothetical protein